MCEGLKFNKPQQWCVDEPLGEEKSSEALEKVRVYDYGVTHGFGRWGSAPLSVWGLLEWEVAT